MEGPLTAQDVTPAPDQTKGGKGPLIMIQAKVSILVLTFLWFWFPLKHHASRLKSWSDLRLMRSALPSALSLPIVRLAQTSQPVISLKTAD
jgi:hypothetical protein